MATKHDRDLTMVDVAEGRAQVVVCPDCGQLEIWSNGECNDGSEGPDHGVCRCAEKPCWCEEEAAE